MVRARASARLVVVSGHRQSPCVAYPSRSHWQVFSVSHKKDPGPATPPAPPLPPPLPLCPCMNPQQAACLWWLWTSCLILVAGAEVVTIPTHVACPPSPVCMGCPSEDAHVVMGTEGVTIEFDVPGGENHLDCTVVVSSGDPSVRLEVLPPHLDAPTTLPAAAGTPTIWVHDGNTTAQPFVNPLYFSSSDWLVGRANTVPVAVSTCGTVTTIRFQQYPPCGGEGCVLPGPLRFSATVTRAVGPAPAGCATRVDDTQAPPCTAGSPGGALQRVVPLLAGAMVRVSSGDLASLLSCPLLFTTEDPGLSVEVEVTGFRDLYWSGAYVTVGDSVERGLLHQSSGSTPSLVETPTLRSCSPYLRLELHTPAAQGPWAQAPRLLLGATVKLVPSGDPAQGPCAHRTHALQDYCSDATSPAPPAVPVVHVGTGDRLTLLPLPPLAQWVQPHSPGVACRVLLEAQDGVSAVAFAVEAILAAFQTTESSYLVTVRDGRNRCADPAGQVSVIVLVCMAGWACPMPPPLPPGPIVS
jgi:hypothetical protein